jgi:hypothetical protein
VRSIRRAFLKNSEVSCSGDGMHSFLKAMAILLFLNTDNRKCLSCCGDAAPHSPFPSPASPWAPGGNENHPYLALEPVDGMAEVLGGLLIEVRDSFVKN